MTRTYKAWAVLCADEGNAGLLCEHADDGSGDKSPVLFRNREDASNYVAEKITQTDYYSEPARVSITIEVLGTPKRKRKETP